MDWGVGSNIMDHDDDEYAHSVQKKSNRVNCVLLVCTKGVVKLSF